MSEHVDLSDLDIALSPPAGGTARAALLSEFAREHLGVLVPLAAAVAAAGAAGVKSFYEAMLESYVADQLQIPREYVSITGVSVGSYIAATIAIVAVGLAVIYLPARRIAFSRFLITCSAVAYVALGAALAGAAVVFTDPGVYSRAATLAYVVVFLLAGLGYAAFILAAIRYLTTPANVAPTKKKPAARRRGRVRSRFATEWARGSDDTANTVAGISLIVVALTLGYVLMLMFVFVVVGGLQATLGERTLMALPGREETNVEVVMIDGGRAVVQKLSQNESGRWEVCGPAPIVKTEGIRLRVVEVDLSALKPTCTR